MYIFSIKFLMNILSIELMIRLQKTFKTCVLNKAFILFYKSLLSSSFTVIIRDAQTTSRQGGLTENFQNSRGGVKFSL